MMPMAQIAAQGDAEWQSNREEESKPGLKARVKAVIKKKEYRAEKGDSGDSGKRRGRSAPSLLKKELAKLPAGKARFISPMKPRLLEAPPTVGDWIYELKFDGIRLIAVKNAEKVNLISRNGNELAARFPEVAGAIRSLLADRERRESLGARGRAFAAGQAKAGPEHDGHPGPAFQAPKRGYHVVEDFGRLDVSFQNSCAASTRRSFRSSYSVSRRAGAHIQPATARSSP